MVATPIKLKLRGLGISQQDGAFQIGISQTNFCQKCSGKKQFLTGQMFDLLEYCGIEDISLSELRTLFDMRKERYHGERERSKRQ